MLFSFVLKKHVLVCSQSAKFGDLRPYSSTSNDKNERYNFQIIFLYWMDRQPFTDSTQQANLTTRTITVNPKAVFSHNRTSISRIHTNDTIHYIKVRQKRDQDECPYTRAT